MRKNNRIQFGGRGNDGGIEMDRLDNGRREQIE